MLRFKFFFFNDTATTEIYTLSLHDALPISKAARQSAREATQQAAVTADHTTQQAIAARQAGQHAVDGADHRSEEHTSELQSRLHLVCRLLLEKKKIKYNRDHHTRTVLSTSV